MDDPAPRLLEIQQALDDLGALTQGDRASHAVLRELVRELDELVATATEYRRAYALILRAAARVRLHLGSDPRSAASQADLASADATAAIAVLHDLTLQGELPARQLLGDPIYRLVAILEWRPDRSYDLASKIDELLRECLELTAAQPLAVSSAAALGRVFALIGEEPGPGDREVPTREIVEKSQWWTDRAMSLLPSIRSRHDQLLCIPDLALAVASSIAIFAQEWLPNDRNTFNGFDLLRRRFEQFDDLETLAVAAVDLDDHARTSLDAAANTLLSAATVLVEKLVAKHGEIEDTAAVYGEAMVLRMLIHRIPASVWDRDAGALEIAARRDDPDDTPQGRLVAYLDKVEIAAFVQVMTVILQDGGERRDVPTTALFSAIVTLGRMPPQASPGHLANAVLWAIEDGPALPDIEKDMHALLEPFSDSRPAGAGGLEGTWPLEVWPVVYRWLLQPDIDVATVRADVLQLLADVCVPTARRNLARGSWYTARLLRTATDVFGAKSFDYTAMLLDCVDLARTRLDELGETAPVLAFARAELLFIRAQDDQRWYAHTARAAESVVQHIDARPDLPDAESPFTNEALIVSLRLAAVSSAAQDELAGRAVSAGTAGFVSRLRQLADDPMLDPSDRDLARGYAEEVDVLARATAGDGASLADADWKSLATLRPVLYLMSVVRTTDPALAPPIDDALVSAAVGALLRDGMRLTGVPAARARHLEALTRDLARDRLGLTDAQRLALGRLAADILDPSSPETAQMALVVALNLEELTLDPLLADEYAALAEDIAERYLPAALRNLGDARTTAQFTLSRAIAALNLGAVRSAEHSHRLRVAMAAHLLAVRASHADAAAWSAYLVAELLRLAGLAVSSRRWYSVHDHWRAKGGLANEVYAELHDGIAYDRRQLEDELAASGPGTGG